MTSRFDVERAVLRSNLPAGWRHVCHVLCTYVDADAGVILSRFQPSLTQLARDTGYHRRTIMRYLNGLEEREWVGRRRPTAADARTKHARTNYTIFVGKSLPQAEGTESPAQPDNSNKREQGLETGGPVAGGSPSPELGTGSPRSGGGVSPRSSSSSMSSREDVIGAVINAIRAKDRVTVSAEWAARVAGQVLGARDNIRDPAAYVHRVISSAPPGTYRPTPTPPRRGETCDWCSKPGHSISECPDRKAAGNDH